MKQQRIIEDICIIILLLLSSVANELTTDYIYPFLISIVLFAISLYQGRINFSKFIILISIPIAFFLYYSFKYNEFFPGYYVRNLTYFITLSSIVAILQDRLWEKVVHFVYILSIISLFFYLWQIISPSTLYGTMKKIQNITHIVTIDENYQGKYYSNILVYTINTDVLKSFSFSRNCGFMFEPGPFGAIIAITLLLNLLQNNFQLFQTKNYILVIVLFTTQSTTGLLIFIITIIFVLVNSHLTAKMRITYSLLLLPTLIFVIQLPFVYNKISKLYTAEEVARNQLYWAKHGSQNVSVGRFAGWALVKNDVKRNVWLGIGPKREELQVNNYKNRVQIVNGIITLLVQYGIIGSLIIYFFLFKSCHFITMKVFPNPLRGRFILFTAIMLFLFSFNIYDMPYFFLFLLYKFC